MLVICNDDYKFEQAYLNCNANTVVNVIDASAEFLMGNAANRNCDEATDIKINITKKIKKYCHNNFETCIMHSDFIEHEKLFNDESYAVSLAPIYYPNALKVTIEYTCLCK